MQSQYEVDRKLINIPTFKKGYRTRILVLGSGFAGMAFIKSFLKHIKKGANVELFLVTIKSYHLFTPLLYQVAAGLVNEYHILDPIRMRNSKIPYYVIEAEVREINLQNKFVTTSLGDIEYDYLVIALGSVDNDFGIKGVKQNATALKFPRDAIQIRNKILSSFEKASLLPIDDTLRKSLLTFVVIGGGPTGVELAGAIRDYVKQLCNKYYHINSSECRVVLVEAANRLLLQAREKTAEKCKKILISRGIEVLLNAKVVAVEQDGVILADGTKIVSQNIFWTAGIKVNPVVENISDELVLKKKGKIMVDEYLRVQNYPYAFAIGDNAWIMSKNKLNPVPAMASAAVQEGAYLGEYLACIFNNRKFEKPFIYKDFGLMLSLGRFKGLVELPNGWIISGFLGWLIWRMVHLVKISTMRNKLGVMFDWTMGLFKKRIVTRIE